MDHQWYVLHVFSNFEHKVQRTLTDRIEITGLQYDSSRKINKMQKLIRVKSNEDGKKQNFNYAPVPYNISFSLSP